MGWTLPRTWVQDELVTPALLNTHLRDNLNALSHLVVRKTSNESVVSSTVLQNDDVLLFAVAANEIWLVQLILLWDSGNTGDLKWAFTWPAGATAHVTCVSPVAGAGVTGLSYQTTITSGTGSSLEQLQAGTGIVTKFDGVLINGGTAGNLQFQWAQSTSDGTATIVKANSTLWAVKLA